MDSSKIMAFLAVAETLSFTAAANNLHKNQSALSRQISALESETGILLFDRTTKKVTLTRAGIFLNDKLRKLELDYSRIIDEAAAIQSGYVGSIVMCTTPGRLIGTSLAPIIMSFEKKYPNIRVVIYAEVFRDMQHKLDSFQTDFLFAKFQDFPNRNNQHIAVETINDSLLLPADHPMATRDPSSLSLLDFKDDTFIVLPDGEASSSRKRLEKLADECEITLKTLVAPDLPTVLFWVELGRGISLANIVSVLRPGNPRLKMIRLPKMDYSVTSIIWNKDNISASGKVFVDFVREYIKERPLITDDL